MTEYDVITVRANDAPDWKLAERWPGDLRQAIVAMNVDAAAAAAADDHEALFGPTDGPRWHRVSRPGRPSGA
jgi:hypothetical protein